MAGKIIDNQQKSFGHSSVDNLTQRNNTSGLFTKFPSSSFLPILNSLDQNNLSAAFQLSAPTDTFSYAFLLDEEADIPESFLGSNHLFRFIPSTVSATFTITGCDEAVNIKIYLKRTLLKSYDCPGTNSFLGINTASTGSIHWGEIQYKASFSETSNFTTTISIGTPSEFINFSVNE